MKLSIIIFGCILILFLQYYGVTPVKGWRPGKEGGGVGDREWGRGVAGVPSIAIIIMNVIRVISFNKLINLNKIELYDDNLLIWTI